MEILLAVKEAVARIEGQLEGISKRLDKLEERLNNVNCVNLDTQYKIGFLAGKLALIAGIVSAIVSACITLALKLFQ
ncbi:hypothetical protein [Thermogutta sp.]|uniref:hypothetical protein n=1 Tax=Thermogutta sp. TaxID=1962930 RepID=UPI00321FC704